MRRVLSLYLLLCFCSVAALPQSKTAQVPPFGEVDPFKITKGSSFSASTPRTNGGGTTDPAAPAIPNDKISRDFAEALDVIRRNYVDGPKVNYNDLTKDAIDSMLHVLDPHSNYFDAAEYQDLLTDQQSEYFGIGATIANYDKGPDLGTYVVATFPESPAARAGLRFGDRIVAVNGEQMNGKDSGYVRDKVRGRKGTLVRMLVERADTRRQEIVEMRRNRVPQPSIPDAYILRDGIGYVDMSEGFNYTTSDELGVALAELKKQGMRSLVLDLRENPGGIVDQAVKVAERFLGAGSVVVTQRGRFPIDNRTWRSQNAAPETMPMVILVNDSTASASEIVAGAMQDYDRALIVGETTFGKGLVQSIINLPYGAGLTLTTARYYTPSGRSIQRDYSSSGLYEYFSHKASSPVPANRPESKTITGRRVFGGDGITPDEKVATDLLSPIQAELLDPVFFFSADLAAGNVRGLEAYRVSGPVRYGSRIRPVDYPVTNEVIAAFRAYIAKNPVWSQFAAPVDGPDKEFVRTRIRANLITAAFGTVAARQVLIEEDRQVAKAVENLPRAGQLAQLASKVRGRR